MILKDNYAIAKHEKLALSVANASSVISEKWQPIEVEGLGIWKAIIIKGNNNPFAKNVQFICFG